jgi:hypothetical protein
MSCFILRKGTSLLEALGGVPAPWMDVQVLRYPPFDLSQSWTEKQGDKIYVVKSSVKETAFNDGMSDEDIELYASHLRHSAVAGLITPSVYEPWSNRIPCSYIFCEMDNCIPLPVQQMMASQLGPGALTFSLKARTLSFHQFPTRSSRCSCESSSRGYQNKGFIRTQWRTLCITCRGEALWL